MGDKPIKYTIVHIKKNSTGNNQWFFDSSSWETDIRKPDFCGQTTVFTIYQ
jgi:hypothetical protein